MAGLETVFLPFFPEYSSCVAFLSCLGRQSFVPTLHWRTILSYPLPSNYSSHGFSEQNANQSKYGAAIIDTLYCTVQLFFLSTVLHSTAILSFPYTVQYSNSFHPLYCTEQLFFPSTVFYCTVQLFFPSLFWVYCYSFHLPVLYEYSALPSALQYDLYFPFTVVIIQLFFSCPVLCSKAILSIPSTVQYSYNCNNSSFHLLYCKVELHILSNGLGCFIRLFFLSRAPNSTAILSVNCSV
jgi:hypothetical protein